MTDYTPENADETQPASTLNTTYTCGECGDEFDTADELGRHTARCDGSDEDEGN